MDGFDHPVISGAAATAASGDDGSNAVNKFGILWDAKITYSLTLPVVPAGANWLPTAFKQQEPEQGQAVLPSLTQSEGVSCSVYENKGDSLFLSFL